MTGSTRSSWWDSTIARTGLIDRTAETAQGAGGGTLRFWLEPLFRADGSGGLLQAVRVELVGDRPPRTATARTEGGTQVTCLVEAAPAGTVRLLLPAVDEDTTVTIELPELEPGVEFAVRMRPQRRWTLHLVQHSHLDIGYTDPQGTVLAEGRSYLDACLDLARATDSWPEEARFRWSVEGLSSFDQWAAARTRRQVDEFVERVREGRLELTAMPFNLHTETCSTDELHELLRPARAVSRRYGVPIVTAMQTDVPGQVVGLPDVLVANGIDYLSVAHNWAGRAVPHLVGGANLPRLFRWRASDGRSVLVWRTDTPHGLAYMEGSIIGFDESYARVDELLPAYLSSLAANPYPHAGKGIPGYPILDAQFDREPYPWDILHLRVLGTFADNGPPRYVAAETVRQWNETWAYPRMRLSRHEDFFRDAEDRVGDSLETFEGDWTDWWVDGVGAGVVPMALNRQAQSTIADAQTLSTLSGILGADSVHEDTQAAPAVYDKISLFNEHTWGAGDPWTHGCVAHQSGERQWIWKYSQAVDAHDRADVLLDRAGARLSERVPRSADALASYAVVNTTNWTRTDRLELFLPDSVVRLDQPVQLVDSRTDELIPFVERAQVNPLHRMAGRFVACIIRDIPAMSIVRLDVQRADEPAEPTAVLDTPTMLENEFLVVQVDLARARISSIVDKGTGRELVSQSSAFGFNGYVYDQYATAGGFNHQSSKTVADDSMHLLAGRWEAPPAAMIARESTAVGETLTYECVPAGTSKLRTTITLPRGIARVDIVNRVVKPSTLVKESAFFAFPFATDNPRIRTETTGGVLGTDLPVVPGSATHMRAVRRWVTLDDTDGTVAWATHDAALVQLGRISIPYVPYPSSMTTDEPGTIYSWAHNNIWDTNFPSEQAFDQEFRYSLAFGPAEAGAGPAEHGMRLAAAQSRPLRAVRATGEPGVAPAAQPLLEVGDPRVRVVGLTSPDDDTVLVRLQSFADESVECQVRPSFDWTSAFSATYLGERLEQLTTTPANAIPVLLPPRGTGALALTRGAVS
ncbi:alpha-mannosidase [Kribbella sp. CA-253562]|uniref:glycoside hydrolase family 38 N-terminal domain-containing protein n=1 Tax=Kribbella sp. CA-253562 TaxID=3239942 RepID=UPI003D8B9371